MGRAKGIAVVSSTSQKHSQAAFKPPVQQPVSFAAKKETPPKRGARFNECGKTKEGSPKGSLEVIYGQEML